MNSFAENTPRSEMLQGDVAKRDTPIRKVFAYNNANVTFASKGGIVMVNATQMAKPFGKSCNDWLKYDHAKRMINAISTSTKIDVADLVKITNGGNSGNGTWMHEDVALVFAQWLSPDFYIWCNNRIKELLTIGMTATQPTLEAMINNPDLVIELATKLKEERQQRQLAESKASLLEEVTKEQAPKVIFADAITGSNTNILIRDLAKMICQNGYEIGEVRLYKWLRDNHYLTLDNKPMQRYVEMGLFFLVEGTHSEKGIMKTHMTTKVTPKGQQYFINKFIQQTLFAYEKEEMA